MVPKAKKKRVLFVDNNEYGFCVRRDLAKDLGGKSTYKPRIASRIIAKRLRAVERTISIKEMQYERETVSTKKASLRRDINFLKKLKEKPFDLVTLDIDMEPISHGRGQNIHNWMSIVRNLRRNAPKTPVVVRASDARYLGKAEKWGARLQRKGSLTMDEIEFADTVRKELSLRQKMSLKEMEKSSRRYPRRESLLGLKFPTIDEFIFYLALDFVSETRPDKKQEHKEYLFHEVRKGRLSPNTFKAVLRCRQQTAQAVSELTLDINGKVVRRIR